MPLGFIDLLYESFKQAVQLIITGDPDVVRVTLL